ncbi:MAG: anthranilate synthase component I family protein [Halobacteriota archaeon]
MNVFGDTDTLTARTPVRDACFHRIPYRSPASIFFKLSAAHDYAFLLESRTGLGNTAQYSYVGCDPTTVVRVKDGVTTVNQRQEYVQDPLEAVQSHIRLKRHAQHRYGFLGGAVGYLSYDAIRYWERLPQTAVDDLSFPDLEMGIYDDGIVLDHVRREAFYFHLEENRYEELSALLRRPCTAGDVAIAHPRLNVGKARYTSMVEKAKAYIAAGDIFQAVLSKRYSFAFSGDLARVYLTLRAMNPSPYMFYLKMQDRAIIGTSPETLVKLTDERIESYPIAGSRPITGDPIRDAELTEELLSDPKELAEHVMLVDLARNDIGRVAEAGSVHVPAFMNVQRYSHVQHIVSLVAGKLAGGADCFDVLRAAFPAGTVSGAPKVRAMEIIEELEPVRRGPYAGAVGYFSYNGDMDFAITIRALFAKGGTCHLQTGGGIVADSVPENEWTETELKARALLKTLENIGGTVR